MNHLTNSAADKLIAPTFLFRFAAPLLKHQHVELSELKLGPKHQLMSFGELEGRPTFADLRAAWSPRGISFQLRTCGKKQPAWCRENCAEDSDGLQLLIDTRNTKTIHRAGRFNHSFYFLPQGRGRTHSEPTALMTDIPRARELPAPATDGSLKVRSERRIDGYLLDGFIGSDALTGWDPREHPCIGFAYLVRDRELGCQTFILREEFPVASDPSLWGTLELTD